MKILIAYASLEGQTRKIVTAAARALQDAGAEVQMFDTADKAAPLAFDTVDRVILAAPVHERRHPLTFEVFIGAHRADLQARKTLMLSVSLNAAFAEGQEEARDYLTEMEMRTKFAADRNVLVAGAVQAGSYEYFETQILRHVVLRDLDYDISDGPKEFTDWDALKSEVAAFLEEPVAG
ncbi:flavodoxin domain-containing protein [Roseobacter sinensis]|uniref:Protoporphyrinogen oxidase n=1 Tax=Roseobacter sinensis TaxID=2931391 RepID=A0ABT3BG62_9RHOB|nr:flavodoxin domain-containing protein [Roseobacter sp. WL0113]MCV3272569.1 protoporphyrinogen oxidase [Roseobacter sp. WL0113]